MLLLRYMEMYVEPVNTNQDIYSVSESAYVRDVRSMGIPATFGSPDIMDYIDNDGFLKQQNDRIDAQEIEQSNYIEVYSESTGILVRVPENIFTFQDDNAKQSYIDSVNAFLNSTKGYFEFSVAHEELSTLPIPTSPRVVADKLFALLEGNLRPNADPAIPFELKTPEVGFDTPQDKYFVREFADGENNLMLECQGVRLTGGMEICFVDNDQDSKMNIMKGIEPQTIATALLALGEIGQEYPYVMDSIIAELVENGKIYANLEVVEEFVKDYVKNMAPVMPAKKYPYTQL